MKGPPNPGKCVPAVSVIIATKNRAEKLARCLTALAAIEYPGPLEVVVVDNGSTDSTLFTVRAAQQQLKVPLRYVYHGTAGVGGALNAGVRRSHGELLIFTDDDCYAEPSLVTAWVDAFQDRGIAFGSGRLLLYDEQDYPLTINTDPRYRPFPAGSLVPPGIFQGANLAVRRDVLEALGLYDPDFGPGSRFRSGADAEVCARAASQGWAGAYVPEPVVYHHHGRTEADVVPLGRRYAYGRGALFAKAMVRFPNRFKYARRFVRILWQDLRTCRYELSAELRGFIAYLLFAATRPIASRVRVARMLRTRYRYLRPRLPSRFPRIIAACRAAVWTMRARRTRQVEFLDRFGHRFVTMPGNWTSFVVGTLGVRDPEILTVLPRVLHDGATVIDVGANIGTYTMPLAWMVGPRGLVVAVEAHPAAFRCLTTNVDTNRASNVRAVHVALGPVPGTLAFEEGAHSNLGETHVAHAGDETAFEVRSTTLDALCAELDVGPVTYVKIDVEGFEIGVLEGARTLLRTNPDVVVQTECDEAHARRYGWSLEDLRALMAQHGLAAYRADRSGHLAEASGRLVGEVFWMSPARHGRLEAPGTVPAAVV